MVDHDPLRISSVPSGRPRIEGLSICKKDKEEVLAACPVLKKETSEKRGKSRLPRERRQRGSPGWILQIRTEAIVSSVFARSAFHVAEKCGTNVADQRLRSVDQR